MVSCWGPKAREGCVRHLVLYLHVETGSSPGAEHHWSSCIGCLPLDTVNKERLVHLDSWEFPVVDQGRSALLL
jgi:hypothetical protein